MGMHEIDKPSPISPITSSNIPPRDISTFDKIPKKTQQTSSPPFSLMESIVGASATQNIANKLPSDHLTPSFLLSMSSLISRNLPLSSFTEKFSIHSTIVYLSQALPSE